MAAETRVAKTQSHARKPWDGNIRDVVSLLVFCRGGGGEKMQILAWEDQNTITLPRKEITAQDTIQEREAGGGSSGTALGTTTAPSPLLIWPRDVSYELVATSLAAEVLKMTPSHINTPQLVQLTRIYVPSLRRHFHHSVFAVEVSSKQLEKVQDLEGRVRLSLPELKKMPQSRLERWNIVIVAEYVSSQIRGKSCDIGASLKEIGPHQIWHQVDSQHMTPDDQLLRSPGYREQDIELLYEEYVRRSYPHATVCFRDMKPFLTDLGWKDKEADIFRAMDGQKTGELGPREFILGLTAMDPMTSHGKGPAEIRCRYIFKYYDKNDDGHLEVSELKELVKDIAELQGLDVTPKTLEERTKKALETFDIEEDSKLSLNNFLVCVGNLRFRGTSLLLRANMSIIPHLVHKYGPSSSQKVRSPFRSPASPGLERKKFRRGSHTDSERDQPSSFVCENNAVVTFFSDSELEQDVVMKSGGSSSPGSIPLSDGAFQSQDSGSYTLAHHTVKVRRSGQITDIHLLLDMERAGEVCDTGFDVDEMVPCDSNGDMQSSSMIAPEVPQLRHRFFDRYQSVEAFNLRSLPNEMITALRFFEHEKSGKPSLNWGEVDMTKLGQYIISMCAAIKDVFENESRLLWLSTPCYILGDIHGNYRDLVCFEKALWRVGPHLTPANFLFLGDYVDRGDYGIEVVSYLFAQKLQATGKFFLLRGNHEVRDIQKMFTFHQECIRKFGERLGANVWNAVNEVFDCMPVAAIVDKKIFCIHGGIPKLDGQVKDLEKIPCPLPNPESQSNLAWQMMWNDPVAAEDMNDDVSEQLMSNNGFAFNEKRQTAYVFNQAAFNAFLERNNLTHVVRAHEVKQAGFEIQQSGRLMTVFSSSHYCGGSNEAACILVHNYRMRIIRIDTS